MHPYIRKIKDLLIRLSGMIQTLMTTARPVAMRLGQRLVDLWKRLFRCLQHYRVRWTPVVIDRGGTYARLCRLDKPIGIFLLLWPTLWALWVAAEGFPRADLFFIFVAGVVLMRSAGCIVNDLADRNFDRNVRRTRTRPLAAGEASVREAILLVLALVSVAFLLVLTTNRLTVQLSFVAVALAIIYPFMKRYTYLPQFVLGLAFGWSIPMAFAAQTGTVPNIAWLLLLGNVLWSVSYDTMYAMVDREDDLRIGVKSTAILFDDNDRFIIGVIQVMLILVLILVGDQLKLGIYYYVGVMAAAIMSIYQQILIRDRQPEHCFRAFLNNNWTGAVIFLGLFMNYLMTST